MVRASLYACLVVSLSLLIGCGSAGESRTIPLAANKGVVLSATLKQGLVTTSVPIKGIEVTFALPQAASPILNSDGSLKIGETGLKNLNPNGSILSGSYDSATRTVHFLLLSNDIATVDLGTGDVARLTYETASGAEISAADIQAVYKVSGPIVNNSTTDISTEIVPSASIVTYLKP